MTLVVKNPLPRLTRRRSLSALVIVLIVLAATLPITLYWVLQRNDMHLRWDIESRYAQQFFFHLDYGSALMQGYILSWNNVTNLVVINELAYADSQLYDISTLDRSHCNTLSRISFALESLSSQNGTQGYIFSMNSSQRFYLATQLESLGHKIINAYWNFGNYTSTSPGVGPGFWYSGPSPPDENLLQSALSVALSFARRIG